MATVLLRIFAILMPDLMILSLVLVILLVLTSELNGFRPQKSKDFVILAPKMNKLNYEMHNFNSKLNEFSSRSNDSNSKNEQI